MLSTLYCRSTKVHIKWWCFGTQTSEQTCLSIEFFVHFFPFIEIIFLNAWVTFNSKSCIFSAAATSLFQPFSAPTTTSYQLLHSFFNKEFLILITHLCSLLAYQLVFTVFKCNWGQFFEIKLKLADVSNGSIRISSCVSIHYLGCFCPNRTCYCRCCT